MGKNHDKMIRDWSYLLNSDSAHQNEPECNENEEDKSDDGVDVEVIPHSYSGDSIPTDATVSIIGDNLNKNIKPRYMWLALGKGTYSRIFSKSSYWHRRVE